MRHAAQPSPGLYVKPGPFLSTSILPTSLCSKYTGRLTIRFLYLFFCEIWQFGGGTVGQRIWRENTGCLEPQGFGYQQASSQLAGRLPSFKFNQKSAAHPCRKSQLSLRDFQLPSPPTDQRTERRSCRPCPLVNRALVRCIHAQPLIARTLIVQAKGQNCMKVYPVGNFPPYSGRSGLNVPDRVLQSGMIAPRQLGRQFAEPPGARVRSRESRDDHVTLKNLIRGRPITGWYARANSSLTRAVQTGFGW